MYHYYCYCSYHYISKTYSSRNIQETSTHFQTFIGGWADNFPQQKWTFHCDSIEPGDFHCHDSQRRCFPYYFKYGSFMLVLSCHSGWSNSHWLIMTPNSVLGSSFWLLQQGAASARVDTNKITIQYSLCKGGHRNFA